MARHVRRGTLLRKQHQRRPYRKSLIVMTLAALLIGGFCYAYYPLLSRAAANLIPSSETAAKSKATGLKTKSPTRSASSSSVATPAPVQKSPRANPSPRVGVSAAATQLCGQAGWPETHVDGGAYIVQNDEWNSAAPECITTDGGAQFSVASSSIYEPTAGDPGGYPAIYSGCSAGQCTTGNKMPIRVSDLTPGTVTSNWVTAQPSSGAYDVSYDIWFNAAPVTSGTPDGGELMIWLAHRGGHQVAPSGRPVAHTTIDGYAYTIWKGPGGPAFDQITYVMDRPVAAVQDFDIGTIAADAASRGYIAGTSYLLNAQAGFEIWQGGRGLATESFAINVRR